MLTFIFSLCIYKQISRVHFMPKNTTLYKFSSFFEKFAYEKEAEKDTAHCQHWRFYFPRLLTSTFFLEKVPSAQFASLMNFPKALKISLPFSSPDYPFSVTSGSCIQTFPEVRPGAKFLVYWRKSFPFQGVVPVFGPERTGF